MDREGLKMAKKKKAGKVEKLGFYRGTYGTYAENDQNADKTVDSAQKRSPRINFGVPKKVKTIRITQRMPKLR